MKIKNIVFYKYIVNGVEKKRACVFYNDGTVDNVSYDRGIDACERLVKEQNISSRNAFKSLINNNLIYVMTKKDLERRFDEFASNSKFIKETEKFENVEEPRAYTYKNNTVTAKKVHVPKHLKKDEVNSVVPPVPVFEKRTKKAEPVSADFDENNDLDSNTDSKSSYVPNFVLSPNNSNEHESERNNDSVEEKTESRVESSSNERINKSNAIEAEIVNNESNNDSAVNRAVKKVKKSKPVKRLVAFGTAAALLVGGIAYSITNRKSLFGSIFKSNISPITAQADELDNTGKSESAFFETGDVQNGDSTITVVDTSKSSDFNFVPSNDNYFGYSYDQLLTVTNNEFQKSAMTKLHDAIIGYNSIFANGHLEEGKDIRAALSWEELVAIQNAYNSFSADQIKAYFNGAEIRSSDLENAYKIATLQLMGAHVIETRECPVDMSMLLECEEGKAFYARYHELFLAAKEATGDDKLAKINAFYSAVRADFPVTDDIRTEGISHSDPRSSITPYKLSVVPMIAAAEMIFQNYEHDYTLDDSQIDFLNDIGLCNYAEETFDRIEQVTLNGKICYGEDDTNPLYEQYRDAIITMMKERGEYVIDDAHRELSLLDAFQNTVNWHFDGEWVWEGYTYYTTRTYQQVETHTVTETHTEEVEERVEKPIPEDVKEEIDREIEEENEKERQRAEEEAERERERLQEEADAEAERVREEVRQDEIDLQEDIEDANERIDENHEDDDPTNDVPVNEEDFGDHNVDFDDDFSDDHGNLDPSVEHITTDDTDAKTEADLPDPDETGARFDEEPRSNSGDEAPAAGAGVDESHEEEHHEEHHEEVYVEEPHEEEHHEEHHEEVYVEEPHEEEHHEEHHEEVYVEESRPNESYEVSYEDAVDAYVEDLAYSVDDYDDSYEYTL